MTFAEQLADHVDGVFLNPDHFAEEVVITPPEGSPVTLSAVIEPVMAEEEDGQRGREDWQEWRVFVSSSDLPSPSSRMVATLPAAYFPAGSLANMRQCAVSRPPVVEHGMVTLYVGRHASMEISRDGYRGPSRRRGPKI